MGLYEQVDYDFSGPLQPQDLFGREYVTMGGVIDHQLTTGSDFCCGWSVFIVGTLFYIACDRCAVAVQNQQNLRSNASLYRPVVVLRPGRPEVRILPVAPRAAPYGVLLFLFCMDFTVQ